MRSFRLCMLIVVLTAFGCSSTTDESDGACAGKCDNPAGFFANMRNYEHRVLVVPPSVNDDDALYRPFEFADGRYRFRPANNLVSTKQLGEIVQKSIFPVASGLLAQSGDSTDVIDHFIKSTGIVLEDVLKTVRLQDLPETSSPMQILYAPVDREYNPYSGTRVRFEKFADGDKLAYLVDETVFDKIGDKFRDVSFFETELGGKIEPIYMVASLFSFDLNRTAPALKVQFILGLAPRDIPMEVQNDQVTITGIEVPDSGVASEKPLAFLNIDVPLKKAGSDEWINSFEDVGDIPVKVLFGALGQYDASEGFFRPQSGKGAKVPTIRGKKLGLDIDFKVHNFEISLSRQEVQELDIFLSVGFKKLKLGHINSNDIDSQFESEINNRVDESLSEQAITDLIVTHLFGKGATS